MQPHEQRVVDERNELTEKHSKLGQFLESDLYGDLPYEDRKLLTIQHGIMNAYVETLNARIGRFT